MDSGNVDIVAVEESSVILRLIPFAFHCISRRQLVGVGVETGPGSFRYHRHTEAEVVAAVP